MFNTPNGLNCLMSNSSSDPISYSSPQVHLLLSVWKSDAYQSPETYYSLFLIIFYGLIFCLIDFSCSSLSSRLRHRPLRSPTTQWHRQLRRLVNPDKEAGRTSHFDIYTAVFTTRVYNLCPFTPFSLACLLACSQIGWQLLHVDFDRKRSRESITAIWPFCICVRVKMSEGGHADKTRTCHA